MTSIKNFNVNRYNCDSTVVIPTSFLRTIGAQHGLNKMKIELNPDDGSLTLRIYDERIEKRNQWVNEMMARTRRWQTTFKTYKDTTIAAVVVRGKVELGISRPAHGDKYDERVGKAVAFAKAMGEHIPSYV